MKIKFISIVFYIIFCLNSNLLSDENSKILKVGLLAPLSGPYDEIGNSLLNSLQLALEEIDDKNVIIVPRDSGFNNKEKLSLAINDMNYDAEDMTETADLDAREREFLERTGQTHPMDKPPNMRRYAKDWFAANYVYNNPDVIMKPVNNPSIAGMSGFSNQSNFYVEDVTDKWGTLNGFSGEVPVDDLNIMPVGVEYEEEENTPFIGFAGLGSGWDTVETNAVRFAKVFGKSTAAFGVEQVKAISDLDVEETLTFGALALGAAATLGIVAYASTKGTFSGLGSFAKGIGAGRAKVIDAKARARERKIEAKYEGKERIIDAKARAREKKGGALGAVFGKPKPSAS